MLTITINNAYLALGTDFSLRMRWVNPACKMDKIPGDLGLGIEIPVNPTNRAILGNPERFEKYSSGDDRKYTGAEIRYGGVLLMQGTLVINNAAENYSCWLQSDLGAMAEEQQTKNITDFEWETGKAYSNKAIAAFEDDTDDYGVLPLKNRGFWEGKGKEVTWTEEYLDENLRIQYADKTASFLSYQHYLNHGYWVNKSNGSHVVTSGDGAVVSPFLYLRYVLEQSLRLNNWSINRNDITDSEIAYDASFMKNLMVYNNYNIMDATYNEVETTYHSWNYEENQLEQDIEVDTITVTAWSPIAFDYADLLPKAKYKDLLLGIQNTLNYIFRFRNDAKVDIVDRNAILATTPIDIDEFFVGKWEIGERKNVRLKFEPAYDDNDGRFDNEFEDLSDRWADYGDPVETYDDLEDIVYPGFGELRLVKDVNKIYEYKWYVQTAESITRIEEQFDVIGWQFVSSGPQPYIYGDEEKEEVIKSEFSTLQLGTTGFPTAVQKGNIFKMRSTWNDFSLRLLNYDEETHPQALYWEGENGLFVNRWETWARFWKNRLEVAGMFRLPLNAIVYVVENITNTFRTQAGAFIIDEMETEFYVNSVGNTRIKGYKI